VPIRTLDGVELSTSKVKRQPWASNHSATKIRCTSCCATAGSRNSTGARLLASAASSANAIFATLILRKIDASGLDLSNGHFRSADLRGIDLSSARLAGASIKSAKISGVLFPVEVTAEEITLSVVHGTRMRYKK